MNQPPKPPQQRFNRKNRNTLNKSRSQQRIPENEANQRGKKPYKFTPADFQQIKGKQSSRIAEHQPISNRGRAYLRSPKSSNKNSAHTSQMSYADTKTEKSPIQDDPTKITNQFQFQKFVRLSLETKERLKKFQRMDKINIIKEIDQSLQQKLKQQLLRIQELKNSNRKMRTKIFDNEFSLNSIINIAKVFHQIFAQKQELKEYKHKIELQQRKTKQNQNKNSIEARKRQSLEQQVVRLQEQIKQNLQNQQADSAQAIKLMENLIHNKRFHEIESVQNNLWLYRYLTKALKETKQNSIQIEVRRGVMQNWRQLITSYKPEDIVMNEQIRQIIRSIQQWKKYTKNHTISLQREYKNPKNTEKEVTQVQLKNMEGLIQQINKVQSLHNLKNQKNSNNQHNKNTYNNKQIEQTKQINKQMKIQIQKLKQTNRNLANNCNSYSSIVSKIKSALQIDDDQQQPLKDRYQPSILQQYSTKLVLKVNDYKQKIQKLTNQLSNTIQKNNQNNNQNIRQNNNYKQTQQLEDENLLDETQTDNGTINNVFQQIYGVIKNQLMSPDQIEHKLSEVLGKLGINQPANYTNIFKIDKNNEQKQTQHNIENNLSQQQPNLRQTQQKHQIMPVCQTLQQNQLQSKNAQLQQQLHNNHINQENPQLNYRQIQKQQQQDYKLQNGQQIRIFTHNTTQQIPQNIVLIQTNHNDLNIVHDNLDPSNQNKLDIRQTSFDDNIPNSHKQPSKISLQLYNLLRQYQNMSDNPSAQNQLLTQIQQIIMREDQKQKNAEMLLDKSKQSQYQINNLNLQIKNQQQIREQMMEHKGRVVRELEQKIMNLQKQIQSISVRYYESSEELDKIKGNYQQMKSKYETRNADYLALFKQIKQLKNSNNINHQKVQSQQPCIQYLPQNNNNIKSQKDSLQKQHQIIDQRVKQKDNIIQQLTKQNNQLLNKPTNQQLQMHLRVAKQQNQKLINKLKNKQQQIISQQQQIRQLIAKQASNNTQIYSEQLQQIRQELTQVIQIKQKQIQALNKENQYLHKLLHKKSNCICKVGNSVQSALLDQINKKQEESLQEPSLVKTERSNSVKQEEIDHIMNSMGINHIEIDLQSAYKPQNVNEDIVVGVYKANKSDLVQDKAKIDRNLLQNIDHKKQKYSDYLILLKNKMDIILGWLQEKHYLEEDDNIDDTTEYQLFYQKSNSLIQNEQYQKLMENWCNFIKKLFLIVLHVPEQQQQVQMGWERQSNFKLI